MAPPNAISRPRAMLGFQHSPSMFGSESSFLLVLPIGLDAKLRRDWKGRHVIFVFRSIQGLCG